MAGDLDFELVESGREKQMKQVLPSPSEATGAEAAGIGAAYVDS